MVLAPPCDPDDVEHERLRRSIQRKLFAKASAVEIGRYRILEELGRGGMGVVYAAEDPKLDREVAIKLLHRRSEHAAERLVREARALARLSHPNVVELYDVGIADDRVYLVMRYIRGETLAEWLKGDRSRDEVLDVFSRAGRGLAAAHAAGIVHRDFKPSNVLVAGRHEVWVTDFGLARGGDGEPDLPSTGGVSSGGLTQTGTTLGTPAYMAPEQHDDARVDAAADQFAFCASLFEGLTGRRAFAGLTDAELRTAKRVRPDPQGAIPGWLARPLLRGLAEDPEKRWASMDALLGALRPRRRRVWYVAAAVGGIAVALAGAFGAERWARAASANACLDAIPVVWTPARAVAIDEAVAAKGPSYGPDSWKALRQQVAAQAEAITDARRDACGAERKAASILATRRCVEVSQARLAGLLDVVEEDPQSLSANLGLSEALAPVAACSERRSGFKLGLSPSDARDLDRVGVLRTAGRIAEAAALAEQVLQRTPSPIAAVRAKGELGSAATQEGDHAKAMEILTAAFVEAQAQRADPEALRIATKLGYVSRRARDGNATERWAAELEAILARDTGLAPALKAAGLMEVAGRERSLGQHARALALQRDAVAAWREALGDKHPRVALARCTAASTLMHMGRDQEAVDVLLPELEVLSAALGPGHPTLALKWGVLSAAYRGLERFDDALKYVERALSVTRAAYGDEGYAVAVMQGRRGTIRQAMGDADGAREDYKRARALFVDVVGTDHPDIAGLDARLSKLALAEGDAEAAIRLGEKSWEGFREALGRDHPDTLEGCARVAEALLSAGKDATDVAGECVRVASLDGMPDKHKRVADDLWDRARAAAGGRATSRSRAGD